MSAELLDWHVLMALRSGWEGAYKDDLSAFRTLLAHVNDENPDVVAQWHAALTATQINFAPAFITEEATDLNVIVQYSDEPLEEAALGHYVMGSHDEVSGEITDIRGWEERNRVVITCLTRDADMLRPLYVVVKAIMASSLEWFTQWYDGLHYEGGGNLQALGDMLPNFLGSYMRVQRWACMSTFQAPQAARTQITDILISHVDATVDGESGGIEPKE